MLSKIKNFIEKTFTHAKSDEPLRNTFGKVLNNY